MTRAWKIAIAIVVVVVVAVAGIVSTPLVWLLDSPDTGQMIGASVQAAVAIAALLRTLFQHPATGQARGPADTAADTGEAEAPGGAGAGVVRPGNGGADR
ncbi:hypothetical protein [Streptomyces sp. ICC1]|uniref:hypothetical protein n=1 Tax=Streptomyces sp. ICC1 TaxID=2099583 RepID=UPI0031BAEBB1